MLCDGVGLSSLSLHHPAAPRAKPIDQPCRGSCIPISGQGPYVFYEEGLQVVREGEHGPASRVSKIEMPFSKPRCGHVSHCIHPGRARKALAMTDDGGQRAGF
jgi:hypothetical protein